MKEKNNINLSRTLTTKQNNDLAKSVSEKPNKKPNNKEEKEKAKKEKEDKLKEDKVKKQKDNTIKSLEEIIKQKDLIIKNFESLLGKNKCEKEVIEKNETNSEEKQKPTNQEKNL